MCLSIQGPIHKESRTCQSLATTQTPQVTSRRSRLCLTLRHYRVHFLLLRAISHPVPDRLWHHGRGHWPHQLHCRSSTQINQGGMLIYGLRD